MLLKVREGYPVRMIHKGIWYDFSKGEVKECTESLLLSFRETLVMVEQPVVPVSPPTLSVGLPKAEEPTSIEPIGMPVIKAEEPIKKTVPKKTMKKKKAKKKTIKNKIK